MSAQHKRPLYAFVIVAIVCGLVIADAIRSQAMLGVVRDGVSSIVAGPSLAHEEPSRVSPDARSTRRVSVPVAASTQPAAAAQATAPAPGDPADTASVDQSAGQHADESADPGQTAAVPAPTEVPPAVDQALGEVLDEVEEQVPGLEPDDPLAVGPNQDPGSLSGGTLTGPGQDNGLAPGQADSGPNGVAAGHDKHEAKGEAKDTGEAKHEGKDKGKHEGKHEGKDKGND